MVGLRWVQCRRVRAGLWDYASERLSEGPMERVEAHLPGCASCRAELEALRRAQCLLSACRAQEEPAPRSSWSDLQQRIVAEGLAHVTPSSPSRRSTAATGLSYAARSGRAPWSMQLATSMAGGFAAVLVLALGYRVLPLNRTGAATPLSTRGSRQTDVSSAPETKFAARSETRQEDKQGSHSYGPQTMASMMGFFNTLRVEPQTPGTPAPVAVPVPRTSVPRLRAPGVNRRRVQIAAAKALGGPNNRLAANRTSHRKGSTSKAADRSTDTSQTAARAALEHVQPVGYESDDANGYVVGSVLPVSHEDDHDY